METCDRCGPTVPAQIKFVMRETLLPLAFCSHHTSAVRDALEPQCVATLVRTDDGWLERLVSNA